MSDKKLTQIQRQDSLASLEQGEKRNEKESTRGDMQYVYERET